MNPLSILQYSVKAIRERKLRSGLTILMVLLGAMLLTGLNGLGQGFSYNIDKEFSALAPDVLTITPSPLIGGPGEDPNEVIQEPPVKLNDRTLKALGSIEGVEKVIPSFRSGVNLAKAGKAQQTSLIGIAPKDLPYVLPGMEFLDGGFQGERDMTGMLLGYTVAFPGGETQDAFASVGDMVCANISQVEEIGGIERAVYNKKCFVVRGILDETGNIFYDQSVSISLQSANSYMNKGFEYDQIFVVSEDDDLNDFIEEDIREIYGDAIGVTTPAQLRETIQGFVQSFNVFLSSIGFISLLVGGVGIITTLYTSVTERTKELGTLKAIGASNSNIVLLILFEALIIGVIGASLGLGAGYALGWVLTQYGFGAQFGDLIPIFLVRDLINVWLTAFILSIVSGVYPAWRASKMTPMEALRRD